MIASKAISAPLALVSLSVIKLSTLESVTAVASVFLIASLNDIFISVIISLLLLSFILYSYLIIIGFKYFGPKSRNYLDFCK